MKAIIQRVKSASVSVNEKLVSSIESGYLILLGVYDGDTAEDAVILAKKTAMLRINSDENDKMNLSLLDTGGGALVVSNFTLCADTSHGNRPSFISAARPDTALPLYEQYSVELKNNGVHDVKNGIFGADMQVSLINDGPITITLNTDDWR